MSKWINVKDELPKESGKYMTYDDLENYTAILYYSEKNKLFNAFDCQNKEKAECNSLRVSHWMPLPEPPEEAE